MRAKFILAGAALLGLGAAAMAQTISVPYVQSLNQNDAVAVVSHSQPSAQSKFAAPGWIGGQEQYSYQVPLTGFAITIPAHTSVMMINPAGTLATGAFTMEANPSDGQRVCIVSTQTQTAMTVSGNTGQTIGGAAAATALAANTQVCYRYIGVTSTWYRYLNAAT
jgi:hypothetical protein